MTELLWPFALRFYNAPDVQATCLALQDRHGADVNVLLCLLWRSSLGESLPEADIARLDDAVRSWRVSVVQPLRAVRRELKGRALHPDPKAQEGFRDRLKVIELDSERLELVILEASCSRVVRDEDAACGAALHNLARYENLLGTTFESEAKQILLRPFPTG